MSCLAEDVGGYSLIVGSCGVNIYFSYMQNNIVKNGL